MVFECMFLFVGILDTVSFKVDVQCQTHNVVKPGDPNSLHVIASLIPESHKNHEIWYLEDIVSENKLRGPPVILTTAALERTITTGCCSQYNPSARRLRPKFSHL